MMARDRATVRVDDAAIGRTVAALKGRNIDAVVAEDGAEALSLLQGMIPDGAEVFKSISETLDTIGYSDYIRETGRYKNLYGGWRRSRTGSGSGSCGGWPAWRSIMWEASTPLRKPER